MKRPVSVLSRYCHPAEETSHRHSAEKTENCFLLSLTAPATHFLPPFSPSLPSRGNPGQTPPTRVGRQGHLGAVHTHTHELKLLLCCPNTNWDTAVLQLKPVLAAAPPPRQDTKTRQPPGSPPPYVILLRPKSISCNNQVLAVSLYTMDCPKPLHPGQLVTSKCQAAAENSKSCTLRRSNSRQLYSQHHPLSAAQEATEGSLQTMAQTLQPRGQALQDPGHPATPFLLGG